MHGQEMQRSYYIGILFISLSELANSIHSKLYYNLVLGVRMRIMCLTQSVWNEMAKRGRDDVYDCEDVSGTPCYPPPVPFTGTGNCMKCAKMQ